MHLPLTRRRLLHGMGLAPLASLGLVATATAAAPDTWHMPDEGDAHRATWMSFGPSERVWGRRLLKPAREHLAQIAAPSPPSSPCTCWCASRSMTWPRACAATA